MVRICFKLIYRHVIHVLCSDDWIPRRFVWIAFCRWIKDTYWLILSLLKCSYCVTCRCHIQTSHFRLDPVWSLDSENQQKKVFLIHESDLNIHKCFTWTRIFLSGVDPIDSVIFDPLAMALLAFFGLLLVDFFSIALRFFGTWLACAVRTWWS